MHMNSRIHIVVDYAEKERFRRLAERAGKSLSEWLRDVARTQADLESARPRLEAEGDLERFFLECDARELGREPDWEDHLKVIRGSRASGAADT
jgi:hypothetical protein